MNAMTPRILDAKTAINLSDRKETPMSMSFWVPNSIREKNGLICLKSKHLPQFFTMYEYEYQFLLSTNLIIVYKDHRLEYQQELLSLYLLRSQQIYFSYDCLYPWLLISFCRDTSQPVSAMSLLKSKNVNLAWLSWCFSNETGHRIKYSVRGLERSELGGSHGCPGRLWNRFLWQAYQNDSRHEALDRV